MANNPHPFANAPVASPVGTSKKPRNPKFRCHQCRKPLTKHFIQIKDTERKYCYGCEGSARKDAARVLEAMSKSDRSHLEMQHMLDRAERNPMAKAENGGVFSDSNGYGDSEPDK